MNASPVLRAALAAIALAFPVPSRADYDVQVDLKNVSGEVKTNWPVILRVYTVLGRCLPPGSVNPNGFHVYDPSGKEIPWALERTPPYDQVGNDEIAFVILRIRPGQVLRYRITNSAVRSRMQTKIDIVGSRHNLIADGGFEAADGPRPQHFAGAGVLDSKVRHSGGSSLVLTANDQTVSAKYDRTIRLREGSWYYFGAWSRTSGVARFGYQARGGGYARLTTLDPATNKPINAFGGAVTPQCSTRDWLKMVLEANPTAWGMDRYTAQAVAGEAALELVLTQPKHYYMGNAGAAGSWWLDDMVLMEQPEVNVRFDLALEPLMKDGVFLFARPPHTYLGKLDDKGRAAREWCSYPYPHERLSRLDAFALKGQRISFCVGVYHTREIRDVIVRLAGGALSAGQTKLPLELVEYLPGFVGEGRGRYMKVLSETGPVEPVTLAGDKGVRYFFLTFHVPTSARPGKYSGKVEVLFDTNKLSEAVPIALRVQDIVQPAPKDAFVGMIFQGSQPPFNDEGLKVYSRSGFTCLTRFGGFLSYEKDQKGDWQVGLKSLHEKMRWLRKYGLTGVCVFSDFDLGPKWNGGALLKRTRPADFNQGKRPWGDRLRTAKSAWQAQIRRIEAARKKHPDWPTLIYMTWDEPNLRGGRNGRPDAAMGWVNEVAPQALTTLDVQFAPLPVCIQWYRMPAFDDPANWAGPEIYRWVKRRGKRFGFCGSAREEGDSCRYQAGMMMIATGASYFHAWHLGRPQKMAHNIAYDKASGRVVRAVSMVNWGAGMNDLKAYHLLREAMAKARKSDDPDKRRALQAAEAYLAKVFAVFNGDHKPTWPNEPYLGTTTDWACEGFYDQWQERMVRYAADLLGIEWVE